MIKIIKKNFSIKNSAFKNIDESILARKISFKHWYSERVSLNLKNIDPKWSANLGQQNN